MFTRGFRRYSLLDRLYRSIWSNDLTRGYFYQQISKINPVASPTTSNPNSTRSLQKEMRKVWLQELSQGDRFVSIDPDSGNLKEKITFTFLIMDILNLPKVDRTSLIDQGKLNNYFKLVTAVLNASLSQKDDMIPEQVFPNFVYRLSLMDAAEKGRVLENIGVDSLTEFLNKVLKKLSLKRFPNGFLLIVRALDKFVKNNFDNRIDLSRRLIEDKRLRYQLRSSYQYLIKNYLFKDLNRQIFETSSKFLYIVDVLTNSFEINLFDVNNAERFAKFLIFNLRKSFPTHSDSDCGDLKMSHGQALLQFYRVFKNVERSTGISAECLQNLSEIWLDFWLKNCEKIFVQYPQPTGFTISLVDNFLAISLQNKKFDILRQNGVRILEILRGGIVDDKKRMAILQTLKQYNETEVNNLMIEWLAALNT